MNLRRLADRVFEAPDLDDLTRLLTHDLPRAVGALGATLLLWDRKLDSFESLAPGTPRAAAGDAAPEARYLLSEGELIDSGEGKGRGTLLPLLARSGLIGMLAVGPRRRSREPPWSPSEVRQLSALAKRCALAVENHLYQRELIASERLTALGTMAGMLVHDFRGPMTVIRGYAETLLDPELPREEVMARAALITESVDRLQRMTTETLDFARGGGRIVRRSLNLAKLLGLLAFEISEETPGIELVRDLHLPPGATGSLDVDKLHRTLGNIAANARDAMGGKGRLHLRAEIESLEAGGVPRLVLTLRDEGPGVPAEIRDQIFDPFVTRGKKGGTGLGLAVARRFVEDHGGSIALLPGGPGACFRIVLPLVATPEERTRAAESSVESGA
ncbi:MAG: ATP-binding protein [Vicinamibacteria bacterium]